MESLPDLKRSGSPKTVPSTSPRRAMSPSTKPPVERTISLRTIGDSMRALVAAEEKQDVPAMPGRESEKPFPFVKLHVVVPEKVVVRPSSPNPSSSIGNMITFHLYQIAVGSLIAL